MAACPPDPEVVQNLTAAVEEAFANAPPSALVALERDPIAQFEASDLLCAHKYVMERNLHEWIASQNRDKGVAPTRQQVLAQLPARIAAQAPAEVRSRLCKLATGSPRAQRKWLSRFRRRWGAKFGLLRTQEHVSVEERRLKVGLNRKDRLSAFGSGLMFRGPIFGSVFWACLWLIW